MSEIIVNLPVSLQIECLKYLITPNERILLVGSRDIGKSYFIQKCQNKPFPVFVNMYGFMVSKPNVIVNTVRNNVITKLNSRVQIAELNGLQLQINESILKKTTKIIIMGSLTSSVSIQKIYRYYIPKFINKSIQIEIVLTHSDAPNYTWKHLELRLLKRQMKIHHLHQKIHYISNITGEGYEDCFNYITDDF